VVLSRNLAAEKSERQSKKRRLRNRMVKSRVKTLVKDFIDLVNEKKKDEARKAFIEISSFLDKAVNRGIYHRNTAARKKSRMNLLLNTLGS
jgi:small subunit ribosomal protein S20